MDEPTCGEIPQEQLTYGQVQRIKYELWSPPVDEQFGEAYPQNRIVAEGDSWFDYPLGLDILDQLTDPCTVS